MHRDRIKCKQNKGKPQKFMMCSKYCHNRRALSPYYSSKVNFLQLPYYTAGLIHRLFPLYHQVVPPLPSGYCPFTIRLFPLYHQVIPLYHQLLPHSSSPIFVCRSISINRVLHFGTKWWPKIRSHGDQKFKT